MANLDCKKVYTLFELEEQKPAGYQLLERNYRRFNHSSASPCNQYKIVDIIDDVRFYTYISASGSEATRMEGIIIIEMAPPES